MIGNFCHDPPIININIDTKDALQNYMRLLADQDCPRRVRVGCWASYFCQNLSLLGLYSEEKYATGQKSMDLLSKFEKHDQLTYGSNQAGLDAHRPDN